VEHNVDIGDFSEPPPIVVDQIADDPRHTQAAVYEGRGSEIDDT
jgi:hypothetical protein